jgi:hypothetical protein
MNVLVGLISLGFLAFLATSARVPAALHPGVATLAWAVCTAGFLIVASLVALLGKPYGRYIMLLAAVVFYGVLMAQNVVALSGPYAALGQGVGTKLTANLVRTSLELAINFWALLSLKTREYFTGPAVAP